MNPGKWAAGLCLLAIAARADAQTLFTYGTKTVSKQEFLKAYNKNNADTKPSTAQYREYLELYTRFKLKVQAALDMRLDTLPSQKAELNAFRNQVAESYMNDEASLQSLINEAGERIQKDIELAHIFVALPAGATDQQVKAAQQKINAAYASL